MKNEAIISALSIASLLMGIGHVRSVSARETLQAKEAQAVPPGARAAYRTGVGAETTIAERLGSATAVDVYRVSCSAECIQVDVKDTGPKFDTRFKVEINGSSPGFVGNASAFNPPGDLSNYVEVCSGQNVNSLRRAYISFSEVNAVGPETYDTLITCRTAGGAIISNPTINKVLDQ